jgi:hypothetical protein
LVSPFVGTIGWGFALAADWTSRMSIAWFFVLDLGLKAVAAVILWRFFMRRGRADRLDL